MWLTMWAMGCSTPSPEVREAPPAAAPPTPVAASEGPLLAGVCSVSAGELIEDRWLVVAEDDTTQLTVFDLQAGAPGVLAPVQRVALNELDSTLAESSDLEGMARRGDRLWLVASHDAGLGTERRPERQRLFALGWSIQPAEASAPLSFTVEEGPTTQLIEAGQWASQMYGIMVNTEGRTSTDPHGLSIEALAVAHDDALLLGFRAPVHAGRALVQRLESPVEAARGGAIAWTGPRWLTLDGRGIRALAMDGPDAWRLVAGPVAEAGDFAVYRWSGFDTAGVPERLPIRFADPTLQPEALVRLADGWLVLSDDTAQCGGDVRDAQRARTVRLPG